MITDQDITKLRQVFATKQDHTSLREEIADLRIDLSERMDTRFDTLEVKMDRFLGTVDALQLDNAAGAQRMYRHRLQKRARADGTSIVIPED